MARKIVSVIGLVIVLTLFVTQDAPLIMRIGMVMLCIQFVIAFFTEK